MKKSKISSKEFLEVLLKNAEYYRETLVNDVKEHPEKVWDIIDIAKMTLPKRKFEGWRKRHWSILEPAMVSQIAPVDGWILKVAE